MSHYQHQLIVLKVKLAIKARPFIKFESKKLENFIPNDNIIFVFVWYFNLIKNLILFAGFNTIILIVVAYFGPPCMIR